jgi:hypothetical protein
MPGKIINWKIPFPKKIKNKKVYIYIPKYSKKMLYFPSQKFVSLEKKYCWKISTFLQIV